MFEVKQVIVVINYHQFSLSWVIVLLKKQVHKLLMPSFLTRHPPCLMHARRQKVLLSSQPAFSLA